MSYTIDHDLFMWLNFDGGNFLDSAMKLISGVWIWVPLYMLMLYLVWARDSWRGVALFIVVVAAAMGLSDLVCGIFKHSGPLADVWSDFPPRWRPMFTPELEGLQISADSLRAWRLNPTPDIPTAVHIPDGVVGGGKYGTVSAHAATIVAAMTMGACVVGRRWFTVLAVISALLVCYSRIYLAKHFPIDLVLGALIGATLSLMLYLLYRRVVRGSIVAKKKSKSKL